MDVTTIQAVRGARKRRKRLGRGIGSGHGKTATRGQKGQLARTGSGKRPGFEGSRTPLIRRLPKRGFRYKATSKVPPPHIVNVSQLERFSAGQRVTPAELAQAGLIESVERRVKLLGDGTLTKRLTVVVHAASASATGKISQAGGSIELLTAGPQSAASAAHGREPMPRAQRPPQ